LELCSQAEYLNTLVGAIGVDPAIYDV